MTTREVPEVSSGAEDLLALEQQVCFALSVAARNVVAVYRPVLRDALAHRPPSRLH